MRYFAEIGPGNIVLRVIVARLNSPRSRTSSATAPSREARSSTRRSDMDWIEFAAGFIGGAAFVLLVQAFTRLMNDPS
jgi:hypothetical protein